MAGYTGILHGFIVSRRLASHSASAAHTEDQRGFRTMVTTPVSAINLHLAICCSREGGALLMAVSAQIAHTAIVSGIEGFELDRCTRCQSEVIFGVRLVDLMASATIDVSRSEEHTSELQSPYV